MRLPDDYFVQCQCGAIMKVAMSFVVAGKEIEEHAKRERDTAAETNALIREQLCDCGHMLFIHDKQKMRPCVKGGCYCIKFTKVKWEKEAKG